MNFSTLTTFSLASPQVNGQNVVGVRDKEIAKIIDEADQIVTVTVIPNFLFKHMTAK